MENVFAAKKYPGKEKINEVESSSVTCITDHPGFSSVCLCVPRCVDTSNRIKTVNNMGLDLNHHQCTSRANVTHL